MILEKGFLRWRAFCISRSGNFITMVHKTDLGPLFWGLPLSFQTETRTQMLSLTLHKLTMTIL